jgi:thioredoxin reductase (NADPH)
LAIVVALALFIRTNDGGTADPPSVVELRDTPGDLPEVLVAAEASIRDYWSAELPEVYGKPFHDLAGGFQPKTPSSRRRPRAHHETVGDVRSGSVKRVASAAGERALAVRQVHVFLAAAGRR